MDALNFFQADLHGGVGPFLVTFLATSLHWTPDRIGTVTFAYGIAGLCAQAPIGALVDKFKAKRLIIAVSAALVALACIAIVTGPSYPCDSGWPMGPEREGRSAGDVIVHHSHSAHDHSDWINDRPLLSEILRKPVYLIAFCDLPVRCMLYTLSDKPIWLVAVQILDGVGAGVFGIMQTLVVADLTKATGRFNLAQGAIAIAVGIGASSSNLLGGNVVQWAGYRA